MHRTILSLIAVAGLSAGSAAADVNNGVYRCGHSRAGSPLAVSVEVWWDCGHTCFAYYITNFTGARIYLQLNQAYGGFVNGVVNPGQTRIMRAPQENPAANLACNEYH